MANDLSLYRKMQVVLEIAKSQKVNSLDELILEIKGLQPDNFLTRSYDEKTDSYLTGISYKSIRKTVYLCQQLSLLNHSGKRTDEGVEASRKTQFDRIVARQVRSFLKTAGISLRDLNKTIMKSLRTDPPILSTSKTLWLGTDGQVSYSTFSKMLTLLTQCGGAESSQKKVFIQFKSDA